MRVVNDVPDMTYDDFGLQIHNVALVYSTSMMEPQKNSAKTINTLKDVESMFNLAVAYCTVSKKTLPLYKVIVAGAAGKATTSAFEQVGVVRLSESVILKKSLVRVLIGDLTFVHKQDYADVTSGIGQVSVKVDNGLIVGFILVMRKVDRYVANQG